MDINKIIKQKKCDICHDNIGLYTPWYSVQVRGRFASTGNLKANPITLCTNCFHAYERFLIEREVQENHKRNYMDMKGEKR